MISRDRLEVRTLRCGRNNPGSNPGHGTFFESLFLLEVHPRSFFFSSLTRIFFFFSSLTRILKFLFDHGVNVDAPDINGNTPLDIAMRMRRRACENFLKAAVAARPNGVRVRYVMHFSPLFLNVYSKCLFISPAASCKEGINKQ